MLILGIETSCDETAVSVVRDGKSILSNVVSSSLHLHKKFGGIVPEIATRYHVEVISTLLKQALSQAKVKLEAIDVIAVTYGPGLVGALLVGISLAKALSFAGGIPLVGINHLRAHLYAAGMNKDIPEFPFIGLVVSGGHTSLILVESWDSYKLLGRTRDDAVGEAFDKVAKILGFGYPGGPIIDRLAKQGNPKSIAFPRARLGKSLDFSFSGLKTAVLYYTRDCFMSSVISCQLSVKEKNNKNRRPAAGGRRQCLADIAASFQEAVVDVLIDKSIAACKIKRLNTLVVGGGVCVNSRLRKVLLDRCRTEKIKVHFPLTNLCLDNAAMIAGLGYEMYKQGMVSGLNLSAEPNLGI